MEITELYQKYLETGKVSTDSRQITPDSVFFALRGPSFNANEFAAQALARGARYAVVDEPQFATDNRFLLVDDSLTALQNLAHHHRLQLAIPIIGLTGSNGKTTSKELLHAVLSKKFNAVATKGNLNNHIGVPLTLLGIDRTCEVAIIEMGANHVGEIAALCAICSPTHGFITNIGRAHIGTFGGFDNIIRGKSELYQHLIDNEGVVFINSQNSILSNMAKRFKTPVFYPAKGDYYHCELINDENTLTIMTEAGTRIATQLTGNYNFENVAVALTIGKYFKVDSHLANQAIADYVPGNMRSQIIKKKSNTILLDAYNANPSSMEAAIDNLASLPARRKVAILGEMYELGELAEEEHRRVGLVLKEKKITEAYLCGPMMKAALETYPQGKWFLSKEECIVALLEKPIRDATILIKGSRGMKMEMVLEIL